ncbi:hypothetical protein MP213Fo_09950 [Pseudochrobactrum sp. MP213Fo]
MVTDRVQNLVRIMAVKKPDNDKKTTDISEAVTNRVGRPARISLDDIARVALKIGFDEVTMIGVGQALGVDHSSLYRYVKGRKDLLLAAGDLAITELEWQKKTDNWREFAQGVADSAWNLFERYPGLADAMRELEATPPSGIRAFGVIANQLEEYGFSVDEAVLLIDSMMDMTVDCFTGWRRVYKPGRIGERGIEKVVQSWQVEANRNPDAARPIAIMTRMMTGNPKEWWNKKLFLILEGAESIFERRRLMYEAAE